MPDTKSGDSHDSCCMTAGRAWGVAQPVQELRQGGYCIQNSPSGAAPGLLPVEQAWGHIGQLKSKWGGYHSLSEGSGLEAKLHACMDKYGYQSGGVSLARPPAPQCSCILKRATSLCKACLQVVSAVVGPCTCACAQHARI